MTAKNLGKAALITLFLAALPMKVIAADLGGNCCSDLEERVAELEATTARKGNRKVSLEISGQVNEALLFWDGSVDQINNSNSSGRIRAKGSAKISAEWSAGFLMVLGVDHNGDGDISVRQQALYLKSKSAGALWLGQMSTATDGITGIDNAGTVGSTLGSLTAIGLELGMDGGRQSGVKYVSPNMAGFQVQAAWLDSAATDDDSAFDAAIRYAGEFGTIRVAAGVGYRRTAVEAEVLSGSLSVMEIKSGLYLNAMAGRNKSSSNGLLGVSLGDFGPVGNVPVNRIDQYAVRVGLAKKLNAMGRTAIYAGYGKAEVKGLGNIAGNNIDIEYWEAGLEQKIDAAAMDLYVVYRDGSVTGLDDDVQHIVAGALIRF